MGAPDLRTHPTVTILGEQHVTAVVIGVLPPEQYDESTRMFLLSSAYETLAPPGADRAWSPTCSTSSGCRRTWPTNSRNCCKRDVTAAFGEGWQVDVNRQDYLAWEGGDPIGPIRLVLAGISVLVLLLGALGLVNISLVTVRQRIREIGIRRSFGATASRVFFAVMMESVVATVVAGAVGVFVAVLIVQAPMVRDFVASGLTDVPRVPDRSGDPRHGRRGRGRCARGPAARSRRGARESHRRHSVLSSSSLL